jgi:hypothetical protein
LRNGKAHPECTFVYSKCALEGGTPGDREPPAD